MQDTLLLLDTYNIEGEDLFYSLKKSGMNVAAASINDDGFLADGVISVYGYFLNPKHKKLEGKPKYFNQIRVPEFWEISGNSTSGSIHDKSHERGRIFYLNTDNKRIVKAVDWLDEDGNVRLTDHYDKYGRLYARTAFNGKNQRFNKSYFDIYGCEKIVENYVTGDIILNDNGVTRIFHTKTEFVKYFIMAAGFSNRRLFFNSLSYPFFVSLGMEATDGKREDALFWQEPTGDSIPGNMLSILNGEASRASKVYVQRRDSYEKLVSLGASKDVVKPLGYVYPFERENRHLKQALICTNSDNIEHLTELVEGIPEVTFHIAALTEMSTKLMAYEKYNNVRLYPGVKNKKLDQLFAGCDIYLDVNHGGEIVNAIRRAFINNQLLFGFSNTCHNRLYVNEGHIYESDRVNELIALVKECTDKYSVFDAKLDAQKEHAMFASLEDYNI